MTPVTMFLGPDARCRPHYHASFVIGQLLPAMFPGLARRPYRGPSSHLAGRIAVLPLQSLLISWPRSLWTPSPSPPSPLPLSCPTNEHNSPIVPHYLSRRERDVPTTLPPHSLLRLTSLCSTPSRLTLTLGLIDLGRQYLIQLDPASQAVCSADFGLATSSPTSWPLSSFLWDTT